MESLKTGSKLRCCWTVKHLFTVSLFLYLYGRVSDFETGLDSHISLNISFVRFVLDVESDSQGGKVVLWLQRSAQILYVMKLSMFLLSRSHCSCAFKAVKILFDCTDTVCQYVYTNSSPICVLALMQLADIQCSNIKNIIRQQISKPGKQQTAHLGELCVRRLLIFNFTTEGSVTPEKGGVGFLCNLLTKSSTLHL